MPIFRNKNALRFILIFWQIHTDLDIKNKAQDIKPASIKPSTNFMISFQLFLGAASFNCSNWEKIVERICIQKLVFWFTVPSLLRLRPIEASFCPKNDVPCTKGIKRMASICALPSWQINLKSLLCLQNLFSNRLCQTTKSWLFKVVVEASVF